MKSFGFQWHVTDRCNLSCRHCYQSQVTTRREPALDDLCAMADRIFPALPQRQISVNITGGEPLKSPHLPGLLLQLHRYSNLQEIHIITNGTVTDARILEALGKAPKLGLIKLSVEGGYPETNDPIRGVGNLDRIRKNIGVYKARTKKPIILMATLAKYNLADIENMVAMARTEGAAGVIFERFVPLGVGTALLHQALDPQDWQTAVQTIARAAALQIDPASLLPYTAFWLWLDADTTPTLDGARCNLGDESMALMPDGTVFPCRRLPLPQGNVLSDSLTQILERLSQFRPASMQKRLTGDLCGMCGVETCSGCRALALALKKDVLADDPACALRLL